MKLFLDRLSFCGYREECFAVAKRMFRAIAIMFAVLVLPSIFGNPAFAQDSASPALLRESRVILDEDFNWLTPAAADATLQRIQRAGFNVFIPVVWHGRGTSWPSNLAPKEPIWANKYYRPGYDPLAYLIKKAHQMGIEVHPWFAVALRQRNFLTEYYDGGTPEEAFNVHSPGFRKYIVELMLEVVRKYDVDGINLDYVRTNGICRSDYCIDDYKMKQGRDLRMDIAAQKESNPAWESIARWNADSVEDIVQNFSAEARKIKPDLLISVDSHAALKWLILQGTDSIKWANKGWVDVIFHMEYANLSNIRRPLLSKALTDLKDPDQLVFLAGNYEVSPLSKSIVWPRESKSVVDLIAYSQRLRPAGNGAALYEYRFLTDEQIEQLSAGPFKIPAKPNWKKKRVAN